MKFALFFAFAVMLCGCGGASTNEATSASDPRLAAVQKALNTSHRMRVSVLDGNVCSITSQDAVTLKALTPYRKVPEAHVSAMRTVRQYASVEHRWTVTWNGSTHVEKSRFSSWVTIGRMVVDKVGEDEQRMGMTVAPYRAHFEPNDLGKSLAAAGALAGQAPKDITDGGAVMHKDADGNWVAQL